MRLSTWSPHAAAPKAFAEELPEVAVSVRNFSFDDPSGGMRSGQADGWIDDLDPVARDFWTLGDRREGRPPRIGAHITGFDDLFAAVRAGRVVAASPASVVTVLPFTDLVTGPVRDLEPAGFAVCRRADEPNPAAERFVSAAVALSRRARDGSPA